MNSSTNNILRIGLTGGIASGKSSLANYFSQLGITTISADTIARDLMQAGSPILKQVVQVFGSSILNKQQELDRQKLREIIFQQTNARKQLDKITHPAIRKELVTQANSAKSAYVVLEIPLLIESKLQSLMNRVLVVTIDERTQLDRIMQRDNCSELQAHNIIQSQASNSERLKYADDHVINNGSLAKLKHQVQLLHNKYMTSISKNSTIQGSTRLQQTGINGLDLH